MYPLLTIDLSKIMHNAKVLSDCCAAQGIEVIGVTKCCQGALPVARAMLDGGVHGIGDSRLSSLSSLAKAGIGPLTMLRQPMQGEIGKVVECVDVSLISELAAALLLSREAASRKKAHSVILMVEAGDSREGILPLELPEIVGKIRALPYIRLEGIGTNVACLQKAPPSTKNLELLLELSEEIRSEFSVEVPVISGGNSSALRLLETGQIPHGINQLRVGEGILLGQDTVTYEPVGGLYQDAFQLSAEVIEVREKPATGLAARMETGSATSTRKQAVLALGRQDIADGDLEPMIAGMETLKTSSDHLVVALDNCPQKIRTGEVLTFIPSYFALLAAVTSPFVNKDFVTS